MTSTQKQLAVLDRLIGVAQRKLGALQRKRDAIIGAEIKSRMAEVAELESQLSEAPKPAAKKKRVLRTLLTLAAVGKKVRRKKRAGGKKKKRATALRKVGARKKRSRVARADALAVLSEVIGAAGKDGMSGREAAKKAGVPYNSALKILNAHFAKAGRARGGRFTVKS
jgi:hypothetical protein